jgi:hypothetical protein
MDDYHALGDGPQPAHQRLAGVLAVSVYDAI